jgi:lysozyme
MENLIDMIKRHEGFRNFPYMDSVGKLTVGYGRNLEDVGISKAEAEILLVNDINIATGDLVDILPESTTYGRNRFNALVDMMFNLGKTKFRGFKKMIAALKERNFKKAAMEMLDSKWATQVGYRANDLAYMVEFDKQGV